MRESHLPYIGPSGTPPGYDIFYSGGWVNNAVNFSFMLNQLPGYTELTSFDQYKIDRIELTFIPNQNVSDASNDSAVASGKGKIPLLLIATDLDGAVATPANENILLRYTNHRKAFLSRPFTHGFSPRVSDLVYDASAASAVGFSMPRTSAWIDSAYADVNHYGVVWFLDPGSTSPGNQLDTHWYCNVYVKTWVTLRLFL
jgi:hypothetical protein